MAQTKHPGVNLVPPKDTGRVSWRATWKDPDTGKRKWRTLGPEHARTKETREQWSIKLSRDLRRRLLELEGGAVRAQGTPVQEGIDTFYTAHRRQLRTGTHDTYRIATDKLIRWAGQARIATLDDLTRARLLELREVIEHQPRLSQAAGARRGKMGATSKPKSVHTINRELRTLARVLRYLIDRDLCSKLTHDDVRRALKPLRAPVERMDYLKPKELQRTLESALRHDAATFDATRSEHAGQGDPGTTPRHPEIAPFVVFVLLTGMRFGEAIDLQWSQVDLEALDGSGEPVGEIYIGSESKTAKARTVGLEVSPSLRKLLAALKLRSGGKGYVWELSKGAANAARRRLVLASPDGFGAPKAFGWQALRRSCATYLCNAQGVYGAASAFMESRQLGHSIVTAERHYVGLLRGIPREAKTLETAMQIESQVQQIIAATKARARRGLRSVG